MVRRPRDQGKDGRALRRSFNEKSREPYIEELAGNPMQLTILLDLLHQHGDATPTQRTDLYDTYVDLLLAREANKHPEAVRDHKEELLEIIPFLGWYLHAHTEESQINGRMSVRRPEGGDAALPADIRQPASRSSTNSSRPPAIVCGP